ncbi:hypothetical protein HBI25_177660 [Parastagonospora nodorum]|nr:hypothetical protein HBH46_040160 [Parastagonospora nodorum]KAH5041350.1 hypothetical protein HBI75_043380 [Parastagonospora nodorum]KAH5124370.1 hypothetical protein HBH71_015810 [Parastagonospora nodorum]KAH5552975.1 hypothetical protein HBI25_177660 [Parastagonospora nodorum]KAH5691490.1 hypothetical protein HBI23_003710 [Parastagonospora nodorum]
MGTNAYAEDGLLPGLLRLPNELLLETVSSLSIVDLRRLARVHRKLSFFVGSYLTRYRYNAGLMKLPDELLLEIAQHLGTQANRSHFAQASLRFHPIVMNYVAHYDVRYNGSSLLMYAAGWNLKGMARKIIRLGGDVHTQRGSEHGVDGLRLRPLSNAAYYGHKRMVRLFLMAGAMQLIGPNRVSLEVAIANGHEQIAILLSQELKADDKVREGGDILLKLACEAKMANLVKILLERGYRARTPTEIKHGHSIFLHHLIAEHATRGNFVKRELHDEVYQIASMLLLHKADPDVHQNVRLEAVTARQLARRHPDPRVRLMFSTAETRPTAKIKAAKLQIGHSLTPPTTYNSDDDPWSPDPFSETRYATLWDFLKSPNTDSSTTEDEDIRKDVVHGQDVQAENEVYMLDSSELAAIVRMEKEDKMKRLSISRDPAPLLSSENSHSMLRALSKQESYRFWDQKPVTTTLAVRTPMQKAASKKQQQAVDSFPPLGRTGPTSGANGQRLRTAQQMKGFGESGSGMSSSKTKKRQWVPFSF